LGGIFGTRDIPADIRARRIERVDKALAAAMGKNQYRNANPKFCCTHGGQGITLYFSICFCGCITEENEVCIKIRKRDGKDSKKHWNAILTRVYSLAIKLSVRLRFFFQYGKVSIFEYNIRSKAMAWWNYVLIVVAVVLLAGAYFYKKSKG